MYLPHLLTVGAFLATLAATAPLSTEGAAVVREVEGILKARGGDIYGPDPGSCADKRALDSDPVLKARCGGLRRRGGDIYGPDPASCADKRSDDEDDFEIKKRCGGLGR